MTEKIVLASASPRRQQLLQWAEVPHDVIVADVDESFLPGLEVKEAVAQVALKKARTVAQKLTDKRAILAADTVVVLDGVPIGKPGDRIQAINYLTQLQGNTHQVITGVAIIKDGREVVFTDTTDVEFHTLTPQQIMFYVDKYEPYDKAGGYAIQEWIGVVGIKAINGDFYNVMGLPVSRVVKELETMHGFVRHDD